MKTINKEYVTTYEMIIRRFVDDSRSKGKKIPTYEELTEEEKIQLIALITKNAKKDFVYFMRYILQSDIYFFHDFISKAHEKYKNLCIVASRGIGKTYTVSHALPIWHSFAKNTYYPSKHKSPKWHESMIIAYNDTMAIKFLSDPRDTIEENELLATLIGKNINIDWNKSQLQMANKGAIVGKSFAGAIRGYHEAGIVAIDDLLSDKSELSPTVVKHSINNIVRPITRRFRAKTVIVGTRFSEDDLYGDMEQKALMDNDKGLYGFMKIYVELDHDNRHVYLILEYSGKTERHLDTGNTDIYEFDELEEAQNDDPISFSREYECSILSEKEVPFPKNILLKCRDTKLSYTQNKIEKFIHKGGLDSSNSTKKDSDETVLMIGYLDHDKYVIPANIFMDNTMTAPERIEEIKTVMSNFGRPEILAEKNSMGQTNIDFINKDNYRLIPFNTARLNKIDITEFAEKIVKAFKLRLPYKTPYDKKCTDKFIYQLAGVREKKTRTGLKSYTGTTAHDDLYIAFILMTKQLHDGLTGPTIIRSYKRQDLKDDY